jgi:hypothetical protein
MMWPIHLVLHLDSSPNWLSPGAARNRPPAPPLGVRCRHGETALGVDYLCAAIGVPRIAVPGDAAAEGGLPLQRIWHLQGLSGGAITTIGESGRLQVPKKAVTVDGRGKYLIPGLWDMHVHFRGGKT